MMKLFKKLLLFAAVLVLSHSIFSQNRVKVNYVSDITSIIQKGDTSIIKLEGNVYFYHNNAIINCDTAYYYYQSNKFIGIGNVIVNQDSLYIYGDRINYNRDQGQATIYSDLIKIVDSSAVMYTRNLVFNTNTKVGHYWGGATITQKDNLLESESGYYDANTKIVKLTHNVSAKSSEYVLKTDSLFFNTETEHFFFDTRTYIWRTEGDFLTAEVGDYDKPRNIYNFYKEGYVMTKEQELWSDTLSYYASIEEVILRRNIQVTDTVQSVISFGDYGQYWRKINHVLLTDKPSVLMYDAQAQDTTFLRSDTLFVQPFLDGTTVADTLISDSMKQATEELKNQIAIDSTLQQRMKNSVTDSLFNLRPAAVELPTIDTLKTDSLPAIVAQSVEGYLSDTIVPAKDRRDMTNKELKEAKKKERQARQLARRERFLEWLRNGGMEVKVDTINLDTTKTPPPVNTETTVSDSSGAVKLANKPDSSDYLIRGFGNVKIFRNDFQMVCDTLVGESVDSTVTALGSPVMWNANNQITAARIRAYIIGGEIHRARLFDTPILAQQVDSGRYNQIKGNYMDAMFRRNAIYRLYVNEASQALYYKTEEYEGKQEVEGLIFATSVNMIADIDSNKIVALKLYSDIETTTYPIRKIPGSQIRELDGFKWVPERRPVKEDVFTRVIRASIRKSMEAIPKPDFFLTNAILNQKQLLLRMGIWRDRNEQIPLNRKVIEEL